MMKLHIFIALLLCLSSLQWALVSAGDSDLEPKTKRQKPDEFADLTLEILWQIRLDDLQTKLCDRMLGSKERQDAIAEYWRSISNRDVFQKRMLSACEFHSQSPAEIAIRRGDMASFGDMMAYAGGNQWQYQHEWLIDVFLDRKMPGLDVFFANRKGKELEAETGRAVNFKEPQDRTLLHLAVLDDNRLLGLLILMRRPRMIKNAQGRTPVHLAVHMGESRRDFLRLMVSNLESNELSKTNDQNETPLQMAIAKQNWSAARLLAEHMNAGDLANQNQQSETALIQTLKFKSIVPTETVNLLITRMDAEDLALADNHGMTALHIACARNLRDIALAIINRIPPRHLSLRSTQFRTPLHFAAAMGQLEVVRRLASRMNLDGLLAEDNNHQTAVMLANQFNHAPVVEILRNIIGNAV